MKGSPGSAEKVLRWAKTIFFLISMTASLLLVCAPPLLVAILDLVLPVALLPAAAGSPFSVAAAEIREFRFAASLVDLPILSAARSILFLCAYGIWEGKGRYLGFTAMCSSLSVSYVALKAAVMYGGFPAVAAAAAAGIAGDEGGGRRPEAAAQALMLCSMALGASHVAAAYRSSCRERRKLLVYKIDLEAAPYKKAMV